MQSKARLQRIRMGDAPLHPPGRLVGGVSPNGGPDLEWNGGPLGEAPGSRAHNVGRGADVGLGILQLPDRLTERSLRVTGEEPGQ